MARRHKQNHGLTRRDPETSRRDRVRDAGGWSGRGAYVGPTLGSVNTGIAIFEAPDEASARRIMDEDPVVARGHARGELRPSRISFLRGR